MLGEGGRRRDSQEDEERDERHARGVVLGDVEAEPG